MRQAQSIASVALAVGLIAVGLLLLAPPPASASAGLQAVPDTIAVPAGYTQLFTSRARGVQIYECKDGQWAFHAPRAVLFDPEAHGRTAIHYGGIDRGLTPGPWWEAVGDGSRIRAGNAVSAPSPNPDSIPLLRLEVLERQGSGVFSQVSYIQRLNTVGGVGPTGACVASQQRQVAYTADYVFYGNP
jgi:hypothetical protein